MDGTDFLIPNPVVAFGVDLVKVYVALTAVECVIGFHGK
jgi:hypothetical protein